MESRFTFILVVLAVIVAVSGCSGKQSGATDAVPDAAAQSAKTVEDYAAQTSIALQNSDVNACSSIADDSFRQNCVDNVVLKQALDSGNMESCTSISGDSVRQSCIDSVLVKQAISERNPALCQQISDGGVKEICLNAVGG